ncbi:MAG: S9 family peptidase [Bacteroidales bacterium]|nr:S9 family peptidase [Bacteroidales bacterium]
MKKFLLYSFLWVISAVVLSQEKISLADIWLKYEFFPNYPDEIQNHPDGKSFTILKDNTIVQYDYRKGNEVARIPQETIKDLRVEYYAYSEDGNKILLGHDFKSLYRHSKLGNYTVLDIKRNKLIPIPGQENIRQAELSPDGKFVAYVKENNLYLFNLETMEEVPITQDGQMNAIINGAVDWVYEEEFSIKKGFYWSPDSKYVMYYRFDESNVKTFELTYYKGEVYPEIYEYKYPKAGEDNSLVDVYVYDIHSKKSVKMNLGNDYDQYIPRMYWTFIPGNALIFRLNRLQNHLDILLADVKTGQTQVIYQEDNKYYIEITDNFYVLKDNSGFIFSSEKNGYQQLYFLSLDGKKEYCITPGKYDVNKLVGVDEKNKIVYYLSHEDGPIHCMPYMISLDGKEKKRLFEELGWYEITLSGNAQFMLVSYSNANTPPVYSLYTILGKHIKTLEDNSGLKEKLKKYGFVGKEFFTFTTSEGIVLNGWMMKPAQMNTHKRYPVLMYMYGGPGINTVTNEYDPMNYAWFQLLVQNDYIVVSIDNRGTGGRGEEFKKCTYLNLGKYEVLDQIEGAKYLSKLPYVDSTRIGAFGWSFGGFLSSLCITRGANHFKAAVAVAPVTNWKFYDNIYTERYMRKPSENPDGYEKNSPIFWAKKMKGKFLLVHGMTDDNVHLQNAAELARELVNNNKDFEMFFYPNKNHGIYGGYTRYHLFNKITQFILTNL